MNFLDLFAGAGMFSRAAKHTNMNVIAQVEIDKNCQKLLARHFPEARQLGDIRNVKKEDFAEPINIIAGGSPCQDLSIAGRREGLAGEKSQLWFEYLRLAREIRPEWLVWENVPNALSSNGGRDFRTILMGLDECGYHVAWRVLDAQYFGVPQRRRRIFLVASLRDGSAAKVLFERESLSGTLRTRPQKWEAAAVAGTITASASGTARTGGNANQIDLLVFQKQRSNQFTEGATLASSLLTRNKHDYGDLVAQPQISHRMNHNTGKLESFEVSEDLLSFTPSRYKRGFGSGLKVPQVANTLQANANSGFSDTDEHIVYHDMIRRLTPLECERLQGFPDCWTEGFSDAARYTITGNSLAYPVVQWVFERIAEVQA